MYEVQAIASFDHHGSHKVGDRFTVGSQRQAEELEKKGLVQVLGGAPEMGSTAASTEADSGTGSRKAEGSTGGSTTPTPGELLVGGNAPDVIASLAGLQDKAVLQSALDAEKAGKNRKTVVEVLEAALKAD